MDRIKDRSRVKEDNLPGFESHSLAFAQHHWMHTSFKVGDLKFDFSFQPEPWHSAHYPTMSINLLAINLGTGKVISRSSKVNVNEIISHIKQTRIYFLNLDACLYGCEALFRTFPEYTASVWSNYFRSRSSRRCRRDDYWSEPPNEALNLTKEFGFSSQPTVHEVECLDPKYHPFYDRDDYVDSCILIRKFNSKGPLDYHRIILKDVRGNQINIAYTIAQMRKIFFYRVWKFWRKGYQLPKGKINEFRKSMDLYCSIYKEWKSSLYFSLYQPDQTSDLKFLDLLKLDHSIFPVAHLKKYGTIPASVNEGDYKHFDPIDLVRSGRLPSPEKLLEWTFKHSKALKTFLAEFKKLLPETGLPERPQDFDNWPKGHEKAHEQFLHIRRFLTRLNGKGPYSSFTGMMESKSRGGSSMSLSYYNLEEVFEIIKVFQKFKLGVSFLEGYFHKKIMDSFLSHAIKINQFS